MPVPANRQTEILAYVGGSDEREIRAILNDAADSATNFEKLGSIDYRFAALPGQLRR